MAVSASQLEAIATWCADCMELHAARSAGRRIFLGEDDDRSGPYWPGAQDVPARERRFLGWFMFSFRLPDGRLPAELAVERLQLADQDDALRAVQGHRYVLAVVSTILPPGTVFLELEAERFEVRQRQWARVLQRGHAVAAHLVPVRKGVWLPGPGWVELPLVVGPTMREHLKEFQTDPIAIERVLQGRGEREPSEHFTSHQALTLAEAVARMTEVAQQLGSPELMMSGEDWASLVRDHFDDLAATAFFQEVIRRAGETASIEQVQLVTTLASEIWNATPQPDRGGLTARELNQLNRLQRDQ